MCEVNFRSMTSREVLDQQVGDDLADLRREEPPLAHLDVAALLDVILLMIVA